MELKSWRGRLARWWLCSKRLVITRRAINIELKEYVISKVYEHPCKIWKFQTKEKLTDMSKDLTITGKNIVKSCEERLKQISDVTEPYIKWDITESLVENYWNIILFSSGISSVEDHTSSVVERCIQMLGAISGLGGAMKKTEGLSSKVLEHHRKLAIMEHKVRGLFFISLKVILSISSKPMQFLATRKPSEYRSSSASIRLETHCTSSQIFLAFSWLSNNLRIRRSTTRKFPMDLEDESPRCSPR